MNGTMITLILFCLFCNISAQNNSERPDDSTYNEYFQITPFKTSSGVYYEYVGEMRRSVSTWRIAVFLDIDRQRKYFNDLIARLKKLKEQCRAKEKWCQDLVVLYNWEDKWEMAEELQKEYQNQIEELSISKKRMPKKMTSQLRVRRNVPLLGFLGKIAGPIAGVLNYEDGERYDAAIEDLNAANNNLSLLVGKQTHVVRSQLDTLYLKVQEHGTHLQNLHKHLEDLLEKYKSVVNVRDELERRDVMESLLGALKLGLDHNIRTTSTMLKAVHEARKGEFHPGLLTSEQLRPIIRDIQDNLTDVSFPLLGPRVSIDELIQISTVSIHCEKFNLKVLIDVPLLENHKYQAFRIHPVPIVQEVLVNGTGRAYIKSEYDYLIVDDEERTYLLLMEDDWKSCRKTSTYHACLKGVPIYDIRERPICEVLLLLNPTISALKSCDIQLTTNQESYWRTLKTLGSWIYSFARSELVTIFCHSTSPLKINLQGVGIMKLAPGCSMRTKDATIPATTFQAGQSEMIYESQLHLNLTALSQAISNYGHLIAKSHIEIDSLPEIGLNMSSFEANSRTLEDLEYQLESFALQRHIKDKQSVLIYGSYGGITVVCLIIVVYFCRRPLKFGTDFLTSLLCFCKSRSRNMEISTNAMKTGSIVTVSSTVPLTSVAMPMELMPQNQFENSVNRPI
ncbi:uncharacterized protein LOC122511095 [Leptopilina heterotoma]|uniref:uncharacterized protein LOC122511095 n=1 Tax=Leptopilina heterotoma TaxID=63436 RepID=UPI001CA7CA98|nr:uncharacterized protein LOC122511095 [Leptopilina heterotoma]